MYMCWTSIHIVQPALDACTTNILAPFAKHKNVSNRRIFLTSMVNKGKCVNVAATLSCMCWDFEKTTRYNDKEHLKTNRNGSAGNLDDAEVHKISGVCFVLLSKGHNGCVLRNWHRPGYLYEAGRLYWNGLWHHSHPKCPDGLNNGADLQQFPRTNFSN